MADMQPVYDAFLKADKAAQGGDAQAKTDAKTLADYIRSSSAGPGVPSAPKTIYPNTAAGPGANTPPGAQAPYQPTKTAENVTDPGADDEEKQAMQYMASKAYTPGQQQAAQAGVNVDVPDAPVSTVRASFAATEAQRQNLIAQSIKQKFGPNTPIRTGATGAPGGGVQYFDSDAKQWKLVPESNLGDAAPDIGGAVGATLGALTPATALGGIAGAATGGALGTAIKRGVGNYLGVNDNIPADQKPDLFKEVGKSALTQGGSAAVGTAIIAGVPAGMRLMVRGLDVAESPEAKSIMDAYNQNKAIVDQINISTAPARAEKGNLAPLDLGVAKTAAIPDSNNVANPAAVAMRNNQAILMNYKDLAGKEITRRANNQNVLDLYWQTQVDNPAAFPNLNSRNWQAAVRDDFEKYRDGQLGPYQTQAETAIQAAQGKAQQGAPRSSLDATTGGQIVRKTITDAAKASSDKVDAAYAAYQDKAKYAPDGVSSQYAVPVTDKLNGAIATLNKLKEDGLLPSQAPQASRYAPRIPAQTELAPEDADLLKDFNIPAVDPTKQTVDLAMLDRSIKDLRGEYRVSPDKEMSKANRNMVLGAFTDARDQFMAKPENMEMSAALTKAEAEFTRHQNEFSRSFAADFLEKESGGVPVMKDAHVLDAIMQSASKGSQPDIEGARQLAQVVNGEPGAKKAILDYANAFYNDKYTKLVDGQPVFSPNLHKQFMRDVYPTLQPFLGPVDQTEIGKIGGLIKRVQETTRKNDLAQEAWDTTPAGRMGKKLTSETFVGDFFNSKQSFGDSNFDYIKNNIPESVPKIRTGITAELTNRARNPDTGSVDVSELNRIYQPLKDRFEDYFGKGYTTNLERYIKASQALNAKYDAVPQYTGASLATKASKLILGPLSAENRKLHFFKDMRAESYANRLETALYDPKELSKLTDQIENERPLRAQIGLGAGLGYNDTTQR